jgi:hypothetical protein
MKYVAYLYNLSDSDVDPDGFLGFVATNCWNPGRQLTKNTMY